MLEGTIGYPPGLIAIFCLLVIACIVLDLYLHRSDRPVSLSDAALWSGVWVAVSLGFYGYLWLEYGETHAALYLAGYALEKVLSIDNLMVFLAIFSAFSVPEAYRHRILYYGVIGAILFRLVFVVVGTWLYDLGPWVEILFAAVIGWTAVKMLQQQHGGAEVVDYAHHWSVRLTSRVFPIYPRLAGHNFFVGPRTMARERATNGENHPTLLRRAPTGSGLAASASNLAVLRDQLAELEHDRAAGLIAEERYREARLELERRVLKESFRQARRLQGRIAMDFGL